MININKNLALRDFEKFIVTNFSKKLEYMSNEFNKEQRYILDMFKKRVFLEEVVE